MYIPLELLEFNKLNKTIGWTGHSQTTDSDIKKTCLVLYCFMFYIIYHNQFSQLLFQKTLLKTLADSTYNILVKLHFLFQNIRY